MLFSGGTAYAANSFAEGDKWMSQHRSSANQIRVCNAYTVWQRAPKGISEEDCVLYEPKYSSKLVIFKKIVMKNDRRKQKLSMSQQGFPFKIRDNRGKRVRGRGGQDKTDGKGKQAESGDFLPF